MVNLQQIRSDKDQLHFTYATAATVLIPLAIFLLARLLYDVPDEPQGRIPLGLVYIATAAVLMGLASYGNGYIQEGKYETLQLGLTFFSGYALVIFFLVQGLTDPRFEEVFELRFYGQVSGLLLLTCVLGLASSLIFSLKMKKRVKQQKQEATLRNYTVPPSGDAGTPGTPGTPGENV